MTPSSPTLSHGGNGLPEPLCLYTNLGISFVLVGVFLISDELLLPLNILYFFSILNGKTGLCLIVL